MRYAKTVPVAVCSRKAGNALSYKQMEEMKAAQSLPGTSHSCNQPVTLLRFCKY